MFSHRLDRLVKRDLNKSCWEVRIYSIPTSLIAGPAKDAQSLDRDLMIPLWSAVASSGAPNIRRTWTSPSQSRGGSERWSKGWRAFSMKTDTGHKGYSSWKGLCGDLLEGFQNLKRLYRKYGDGHFTTT